MISIPILYPIHIPITLWSFNMAMENGRFIDDSPINTVIFHSYVQLPEGKTPINATNSHQGLIPVNVLRSYSWSTEQQRWCCRSRFHEYRGLIDADIVMINGRLVPSPIPKDHIVGI